jgi:hypothetical protein
MLGPAAEQYETDPDRAHAERRHDGADAQDDEDGTVEEPGTGFHRALDLMACFFMHGSLSRVLTGINACRKAGFRPCHWQATGDPVS